MSAPETTSLLFEIGCEEIPARFLTEAENKIGAELDAALNGLRYLPNPALKTFSTPRRLVVYIPALYARQPSLINEVVGPPVKVAFDKEGRPTRAAESFAVKYDVKISDLRRVTNAKGEYLVVEHREAGRSALEVLHEVLPAVLGSMAFLKNMYWTAKTGPRFVRPIRWILALLGEDEAAQVVPFEFAGIKSGQWTFGHRLKGSESIRVTGFDDYLKKLREHWVEPDSSVRRERTKQGIKALLEKSNSNEIADEWLETWVVNSTEWPEPIIGSFDERYLALPREVLVTVMRDHQKYFAVEDQAGNLQPQFVTVLNVPGDPERLIRQGHERVLAARFADAEFFWKADQRIPLRDRLPMLERVTYQAKLGTYADKVLRVKSIAENICEELEKSGAMNAAGCQHALRAVELCKCDLTTQMVQEFPELQGIIGGLYAKSQGEPEEVADAIYDHYRPAGVEDSCPRSVTGAVVSLADKLDSVVAGFTVGLEPTGSSDPFGLRRAGNGIIRILIESQIRLQLTDYFDTNDQSRFLALCKFMADREQYILEAVLGFPYDSVRAAMSALEGEGFSDPLDAKRRVEALEYIRGSEDMQAICAAAKRVKNIIEKSVSNKDWEPGSIQDDLLTEGPEVELHKSSLSTTERVLGLRSEDKYVEALKTIAALRPVVDRFFEEVLVMADDNLVRQNRILLLMDLNRLFSSIADLSQIETKALTPVGAPTTKTNGAGPGRRSDQAVSG